MRVPKAIELERACPKEPGRYTGMHRISIETEGDETLAVATNGRILALVPVELEEHDAPGLVQADAWKQARMAGSKRTEGQLSPNGTVRWDVKGGAKAEAARPDGEFPNWRGACPETAKPERDKDAPSIGLNAQSLADLARALGSDTGAVRLTFQTDEKGAIDPTKPIRVDATCGRGAIMPITYDS